MNDKYNKVIELYQKAIEIIGKIKSGDSSTQDFISKYTNKLIAERDYALKKESDLFDGSLPGLSRWLGEWEEMDQYDELLDVIHKIETLYKSSSTKLK